MSTRCGVNDFVVQLCTSNVLKLQLHVGMHKRILVMEIYQANMRDDKNMQLFIMGLSLNKPCISPMPSLSLCKKQPSFLTQSTLSCV